MHPSLTIFLLSFFVFQQTINVESLISPIQNTNNEANRPNIARRLRAPLMGRSLLSVSPASDDEVGFINNDSDSSGSTGDDGELLVLNKRRYGVPLFGRRWAPTKRRGPLFG